jgi:hypothetical protein
MSLLQRMRSLVVRDRTARKRAEHDAPADPANAGSRATGGAPPPGTADSNSTTGTSPNGHFVGRAGGDESGDVGLSGGEARTGERADGRTGAARDE